MPILITILSAISFAFYPPFAKAFYNLGGNPSCFIIVSTYFRTLMLLVFSKNSGEKIIPDRREIKVIFNAGVVQAISILSILAAVNYISPPVVITLLFTHTLMLLGILVIRGEKKLSFLVLLTTIFALIGITFVVGLWEASPSFSIWGICISLVAATATAIRLYLFQKELEGKNPSVVGFQIFFVVSILMTLYGFFVRPVFVQDSLAILYLALGSLSLGLGTLGMFYCIKQIGSFRWSLFLKLEPVFNAIISALLLKEILSLSQYFGMFLVIVSLVMYQLFDRKDAI